MSNYDRKNWGPEEDEALLQLINEIGDTKWSKISKLLVEHYNIRNR